MEMLHISKADSDRIGADYKGVYMDYQGVFPLIILFILLLPVMIIWEAAKKS